MSVRTSKRRLSNFTGPRDRRRSSRMRSGTSWSRISATTPDRYATSCENWSTCTNPSPANAMPWRLRKVCRDGGGGPPNLPADLRPGGRTCRGRRRLASRHLGADEIESLELVNDGEPWFVPWNLVYDEDPAGRSFAETVAVDGLSAFQPFWGMRYNLCGGLPADPLWRMPFPVETRVLFVIDPVVLGDDAGDRNDATRTAWAAL